MYTPMVKQYLEIKGQHPDSILFFRLGDFYEMFFEDASTASRELDIVLTARDGGGQTRIPMCGVPYHSANHYIARLINRGYKVAVCEQMEDPKNVKGIVKREVVRIITPGTLIEDTMLPGSSSNYLAAVVHFKNNCGLAYIDISTGEFMVTEFEGSQAEADLLSELQRISPAECLVEENSEWREKFKGVMDTAVITQVQPQEGIEAAKQFLLKQFNLVSLESFGLEGYTSGLLAASVVLTFLEHTQKTSLRHIKRIKPYHIDRYLQMNFTTYKNLELTGSLREGKKEGALLSILDYCLTSMGKRELKRWIDRPLMDVELINQRLQSVKEIKENLVLKEQIKQHLDAIYDLERLAGKLGSGLANPRDLLSIKLSAQMLRGIKNHLNACKSELLTWICQLDPLTDIRDIIKTSINDDAPATIKEGNIIKSGYNQEIDELRAINQQGARWLVNFENQERIRTGIKNLKVGFNKVYGYYIEVSKANQHLVPPDYYRKQTLVNGERYVCEELKQYEEKLTTAHDRLIALEAEMFEEIRNRLALHIDRILDTANRIAVLDVLYSLAHAAYLHDYVMPEVDYSGKIEIKSGRHPVVENTLKSGFVPNDIKIDQEDRRFCLITGPNMGGKSTFMRQVALIVVPPISITTELDSSMVRATAPIVLAAGPEKTVSHGLIKDISRGIVPPSALSIWMSVFMPLSLIASFIALVN
jgi:DNA mismatch repair protein MutS